MGGFFSSLDHCLCQVDCAFTAFFPVFADDRILRAAFFNGGFADQFQFSRCIGEEAVDRHHHRNAELACGLDVMQQDYAYRRAAVPGSQSV